jgi:hypothetical protein
VPSRPSRLFAIVEAQPGVFDRRRGETWTRVNSDPRVLARPSDATDVRVHPTNPDIVIVPTIVTWKSTDGGRTFTAIRGAPGGDDYQRAWFNPDNPDIIAMTSDQGAIITLNGGESWQLVSRRPRPSITSRPTTRFRIASAAASRRADRSASEPRRRRADHVPRMVHGRRRGLGYVAPDPLDPDIVYGGKVRDGIAAPGRSSKSALVSGVPATIASSARCRCCSRR